MYSILFSLYSVELYSLELYSLLIKVYSLGILFSFYNFKIIFYWITLNLRNYFEKDLIGKEKLILELFFFI